MIAIERSSEYRLIEVYPARRMACKLLALALALSDYVSLPVFSSCSRVALEGSAIVSDLGSTYLDREDSCKVVAGILTSFGVANHFVGSSEAAQVLRNEVF